MQSGGTAADVGGGAASARSGDVPHVLVRLEPLTGVALALHGVAVLAVDPGAWAWSVLVGAGVVLVASLAGLAGRRRPRDVAARAGLVLVVGAALQVVPSPVASYVLLWFFVLSAVYPLVVPPRFGALLVLAVPLVYLGVVAVDAAGPGRASDGTVAIGVIRALSLAFVGAFSLLAADAYRRSAADRDGTLALLDGFVESAPVGMAFLDRDLRVRRVNGALARLDAVPREGHLGRRVEEVLADPGVADAARAALQTRQAVVDLETTAPAPGDPTRTGYWKSSYFPVAAAGEVLGVGVVVTDLTSQVESDERLAHSATHDGLTGLPNRVLLADRLAVALAQADRSQGLVAVMFCDLDRFKVVNDSLGHSAGDVLLRAVARRLAESVRPGDTLARLGGDEFAAVCAGVADLDEARGLGERLRRAVAEPVAVGGRSVSVTASVGLALAAGVPGTDGVEALLRDADVALYAAKDGGRDRVSVADERRRVTASARLDTEDDLRRAVAAQEIRVAYQPVAAMATIDPDGRVEEDGAGRLGFEALARWWSRSSGEVPPSTFIPLAEDLGLILEIGDQVLRRACEAAVRWRYRHARPITVAVNLSARQLAQPGVTELVEGVLRDSGLPPSALQLEITESVLVSDVVRSAERISALRALGVQVAIDDFGTGYSSLAYLRDLPVDVLKIDRSFVNRLPDDERLLGAIVDLAHTLDVVAVAEGVETAEQLEVLRRIGCDRVQGFLLSPPLSPDQTERFLAGQG